MTPINNNQMSELKNILERFGRLYQDYLSECAVYDNPSLWSSDGTKSCVEQLSTLISHERAEAVRKLIKTILCIEGINSDDFSEEMDMKVANKQKFTQEEAKEFQKKMVATYYLTHNIVADCCKNTHDKLLGDIYKSLVDNNFISEGTLGETVEEYLKGVKP
jgi:hypothetical protein